MAALIGGGVMDITAFALDGLARRAEVRANNIANASTPNYLAKTVDFESSLRSHLLRGDLDAVAESSSFNVTQRDGIINENGNSVDLEVETTDMVQDNLMFQAVINGFNYKVGVVRTAIGSR